MCHTNYIHGRYQNLCHFYPGKGLKLGVFGFSCNQNNRGSSGVYVICIYCGLSVKINTHKTPHGMQRSWTHLYCICFCLWHVVSENPKTPILSTMADTGRYRRSGMYCVYLWHVLLTIWYQKLILPKTCSLFYGSASHRGTTGIFFRVGKVIFRGFFPAWNAFSR